MPCIRRIRIDSGGSVNWLTCVLIAARSSSSRCSRGRSRPLAHPVAPVAAATLGAEKRRSPGTAYHLIAMSHQPQREVGVDRVCAVGGQIAAGEQGRLQLRGVPVADGEGDRPLGGHDARRRRRAAGRSPGSRRGRRGAAGSCRGEGRRARSGRDRAARRRTGRRSRRSGRAAPRRRGAPPRSARPRRTRRRARAGSRGPCGRAARGRTDARASAARCGAGSGPRARSRAPRRSARASPRRAPSRPARGEPLDSGSSSVALRRSVSTASATPGYWIFTTTSSPSRVVARWTWPIEAAANARSSKSRNTCCSGPPNSLRISFSRSANGTGGTSSRSAASLRCSSSCSSSGRPSNSTIEIIWPTFIAAPRICPSWSTSSCDQRGGPLALGRRRALGRPHPVGGPHSRPTAGPARSPARRRAPSARRRPVGSLRLGRRIVGVRTHEMRLPMRSIGAERRPSYRLGRIA